MSAGPRRINPALDGADLSRPTKELLLLPGVTPKMIRIARAITGIHAKRNPAANLKPYPAKLADADLTRPTRELCAEYGCTRTAVTYQRRARGIPSPPRTRKAKQPKAPRPPRMAAPKPPRATRPPRTPKPTPTPSATPIARQRASVPRESAAVVAPPVVAPANGIDPAIRAALVDEIRGMGSSPGIAAMLIAARFRVAREVVERIAEDVAGMRREVSNG